MGSPNPTVRCLQRDEIFPPRNTTALRKGTDYSSSVFEITSECAEEQDYVFQHCPFFEISVAMLGPQVQSTDLCCLDTVNLIGSGRDKAHEGRVYQRLYPSGHAGDRGPGLEGLGSGGSILDGGAVIAAGEEQVIDLVVSGEEALGLAS